LSIEVGGHNEMGLANYLVVEGTARITEGGAADLLQRLATVYIGPGVKFPPFDDPPPGYVLRIAPHRVRGTNPWTSDEAVEAADRVRSHQPGERSAGD
jgi:hypothetical protein